MTVSSHRSLESTSSAFSQVDPLWLAYSRLKRKRIAGTIAVCDQILSKNPAQNKRQYGIDEAVWLMKCRALSEEVSIDDTEMEEETVGEILMDDEGK